MENKPASLSSDPRPEEHYNIRIARDGTWFYNGSPIGRLNLVKLFSSVLRRDEQGDFWLITPAERGRIEVEDAPFVAVELMVEGSGEDQRLTFRTNLDQTVTAGSDHPIRVSLDRGSGEAVPYVMVRSGLEARIERSVYYELVDLGVERHSGGQTQIGVWSEQTFFLLGNL
jgi:hypothetical protein